MNRYDQIQAKARDIAGNIHTDPAARDAMADDLIKLIGMMIDATGKHLAVHGESEMNDVSGWEFETDHEDTPESEAERRAEFEADQQYEMITARSMYLTGVQMQSDAHTITVESTNPVVDLDRYHRVTGNEWCVCGHSPNSHRTDERGTYCAGVLDNRQACQGGSCTGFVAKLSEPVWTHVDRRPENLRVASVESVRCESVGQLGYRCTLPTDHLGEHRAEWVRWL